MLNVDAMAINWRPKSAFGARINRWLFEIPSELISFIITLRRCWALDVLLIPAPASSTISAPAGAACRIGYSGGACWRGCAEQKSCSSASERDRSIIHSVAGSCARRPSRQITDPIGMQSHGITWRRSGWRCPLILYIPISSSHSPTTRHRCPPDMTMAPSSLGSASCNTTAGVATRAGIRSVYNAYMNKLEDFAGWVLAQGHDLRIFMGDDCDHDALEDLADRLQALRQSDRQRRGSCCACSVPVGCVREIARCDAVVATRFHNVVAALALGRPVLSIGYAKKNDVLLNEAGMGELCQHIEHLDLERLKAQFTFMLERAQRFCGLCPPDER